MLWDGYGYRVMTVIQLMGPLIYGFGLLASTRVAGTGSDTYHAALTSLCLGLGGCRYILMRIDFSAVCRFIWRRYGALRRTTINSGALPDRLGGMVISTV